MKIALVHDTLNAYGGAEKVLEEFHAIFPKAPIFCSIYQPDAMPADYALWDIRPSWLTKLPGVSFFYRAMLPLYPYAMHGLDLSGFDLVLSSSFNFAHNVVTDGGACHICYCHSPARFLWDFFGYVRREGFSPTKQALVMPFLPRLRTQDFVAAQHVDNWIATSRIVQLRIQKTYGRRSTIIPPPVNLGAFRPARAHQRYFLMIMRLVGWKRADIVIEACSALGLPLVVAGEGRDRARLESLAGPSVEFVGRVDGEAKAELLAGCAALVLPSLEDFGITPLEAMASGRPVIALGEGGVLDTVHPGIHGEFFHEQTTESLAETLRHFDPDTYDPQVLRRQAELFGSSRFRERILSFVQESYRKHRLGLARITPEPTARTPASSMTAS